VVSFNSSESDSAYAAKPCPLTANQTVDDHQPVVNRFALLVNNSAVLLLLIRSHHADAQPVPQLTPSAGCSNGTHDQETFLTEEYLSKLVTDSA
jgi:hypothetical protein